MKNVLTLVIVLSLISLLPLSAHARDNVSIGVRFGAPMYTTPPPTYVVQENPAWFYTPVEVVYVEGRPHYMHYWRRQWYDEAWLPAHRGHSDYYRNRYNRWERDQRRDQRHHRNW